MVIASRTMLGAYVTLDENGMFHSENDAPSYIAEHRQSWHRHGILHRENGPASVFLNSTTWHIFGVQKFTEKEYQDASGLSDEQMVALIFKYGPVSCRS